MALKENLTPGQKICMAPKDTNLIVFLKSAEDGSYSEPNVSTFICSIPVLTIGKKEFLIQNPRIASWIITAITVLTSMVGDLDKVIRIEDQNLMDIHFPKGDCRDCPRYNLKMWEITKGDKSVLLNVFSPDVLTGREKIVHRAELEAQYGKGNKNS
jgi:hypothetical protein